jgi:putative sterol carrier protein
MSLKSGTQLTQPTPASSSSITSAFLPPPTDSRTPDAFPSSAAFDAINSALTSDPSEQKNAIKQGQAIFAFKLKNASGAEEAWHIDLKETGQVAKGEAPTGKKADVTLSLSDENFGKMVSGKAKAQQLFMSGKLKVKGNVMKATKMEPILAKAQGKAKL